MARQGGQRAPYFPKGAHLCLALYWAWGWVLRHLTPDAALIFSSAKWDRLPLPTFLCQCFLNTKPRTGRH